MVQGAGHRLPRGTSQVLTARFELGAELLVARRQAQQPETRMAPGQKTEGEDLLFLGGWLEWDFMVIQWDMNGI